MTAEHGVRKFGFPRRLIDALRDTLHRRNIGFTKDFWFGRSLRIYRSMQFWQYTEIVDGRFTGVAKPVDDKATVLQRLWLMRRGDTEE